MATSVSVTDKLDYKHPFSIFQEQKHKKCNFVNMLQCHIFLSFYNPQILRKHMVFHLSKAKIKLTLFCYIFPFFVYTFKKEKGIFIMKGFYKQTNDNDQTVEILLAPVDLWDSIEKTRRALENAYSGFDNATEQKLIDCYIYEINALQKRYEYLTGLLSSVQAENPEKSSKHSSIRALVSHVFG